MLRIQYDPKSDHSFALVSDYNKSIVDFCRAIKDTYGWRKFTWDIATKRWRFSDPAIIRTFKDSFVALEIDPAVYTFFKEQKVKDVVEEKRAIGVETLKQKTETDFRPRNIKGQLYPFQNVGVEFAKLSNGKALISDAPGLGKTATALAFAADAGFKKIVVICPASVKFAWQNEVEKWTNFGSLVVDSKSNPSDIAETGMEVIILNYDILHKFIHALLFIAPDLCIIDESHMIKNRKSKRSRLVSALAVKTPHKLFLSGTPFLSRPEELFTTLNMLDSRTWNDYYEYTRRYCGGHRDRFGWNAKSATNIEELRKRISKYFIRRLKEDVLKDLPPKVHSSIPVELDEEAKNDYDDAENNLLDFIRDTKGDEAAKRAARAEAIVKLGTLRQITTKGKINAAKEIIDSILEGDEKIIVFSSYKDPLRRLHADYPNSVLLLGDTDLEERQRMIEKFQNDPSTRIFFGGIKAAGIGITLTAANNVLFTDFPWCPSDLTQAEDRSMRIGQKKTVNVIQLFAKDTIDEYMAKLIGEKQGVFSYLFDGKEMSDKESVEWTMLNELLHMLKRKAEDRIV